MEALHEACGRRCSLWEIYPVRAVQGWKEGVCPWGV